ncbi:cytochrome P450 CYP736A12-like [Pyrus ussuriensis x Pyrus communis]|uniref:Cytochrome P450 CYP736A12-like n=1 Tax=Pyrus ussuriensis x Pyrus communis TaxID=2448454 RepID=A0A5N5F2T7_9ROSA|nr:cytochrome P450 CYP736A12-like [Pyrus ussuriensis x Pyrus communis]
MRTPNLGFILGVWCGANVLPSLSLGKYVDETNEKQRKYLDDLFKMHFRQWKFDVLRDTEQGVDAPEED